MGEKPTEGYIAHPADAARLEEAEELHFNDYAKVTTGQEHYVIPQTVSKSAAAKRHRRFHVSSNATSSIS